MTAGPAAGPTASVTAGVTAGLTPSQTVGPFLSLALRWPDGPDVVPAGTPGAFWLRGRVVDGAGQVVPDALVETWQADTNGGFADPEAPLGPVTPGFRGFGRCETVTGSYAIRTVKPGPVPTGGQAPHLDVTVLARGLLDRVVTRVYFPDEEAANAGDDVLRSLPPGRRGTLVATPAPDGYTFDVVLQGAAETVFFRL